MQTIEYRTYDKANWAPGPWMDEPDKIQWPDDATSLPCLIVRNRMGALCGYVGVPAGHPWHGKDYDDIGRYDPKPEDYDPDWYPDVHGGLTFASGCSHGDPAKTICHVPGDGEPDDMWWLGFDCGHAGDLTNMAEDPAWRERWPHPDDVYRDVEYVRGEVGRLAKMAAQAAAPAGTRPKGGDCAAGSVRSTSDAVTRDSAAGAQTPPPQPHGDPNAKG
jgi:hypothetical protein